MTKSGKYECGCGRTYSSHPALSNHQKHKHDNLTQPGTKIPRPYTPKRGRPSFTLPRQKNNQHNYRNYNALTTIEIGLLRLEQKHPGLLSEADEEPNLEVLNCFKQTEDTASASGQRIVGAIRKFSEVVVTHLSEKPGEAAAEYLAGLAGFVLESVPSQEGMDWGELSGCRVDCAVFNQFLQQKGQLDRLRESASQSGTGVQVFLQLTVLLSQYLAALDLATSTLAVRS